MVDEERRGRKKRGGRHIKLQQTTRMASEEWPINKYYFYSLFIPADAD